MKQYVIIIALGTTILFSCAEEKENAKGHVYKREPYHWVRGYYKINVKYAFEYQGDTIYSNFRYGSKYPARFLEVGDSVILSFPRGKPHRSKIVRYQKKQ